MNEQIHPNLFVFDRARTADGLLFITGGDRCRYLGKSSREKPDWLKQNEGRYRRIEDVLREDAPRMSSVEAEINLGAGPVEPADSSSSPEVRNDGDDKDDVALADAPLGDCSRPCEPTSLPTPVTATLTSWSTKAELLPPAKAAMSETKQPKTETTPLGAVGRKRGRRWGRQPENQTLPAEIAKAGRMLSPERMRIVIDSLTEVPILSRAAMKAGIHRRTLEYWLKRSEAGDAGYDIEWQGLEWRFHEHCKSAIWEAEHKLLDRMFERAFFGYDKVLTRRGRVVYKMDQGLVGLGYQGPDAYLRDEDGNPVPETVRKADMKAMRFILEWYRPDTWGKHPKRNAPRGGGGGC